MDYLEEFSCHVTECHGMVFMFLDTMPVVDCLELYAVQGRHIGSLKEGGTKYGATPFAHFIVALPLAALADTRVETRVGQELVRGSTTLKAL